MSSGHQTASVICNEVYYCNDDRITVCNKSNIRDSPTVYIMMYKLTMCEFVAKAGMVGTLYTPTVPAHSFHPYIKQVEE